MTGQKKALPMNRPDQPGSALQVCPNSTLFCGDSQENSSCPWADDPGYADSLGTVTPSPAATSEVNEEVSLDPLPTWPELSPMTLRGFAGDFVKLACKNSEADPAAVLITFLVRYGVEVGAHAFLNVGDTPHYLRLAAVVVGASSKARKGTSARPVKKLFQFDEGSARTSPGPFSSGEGIIFAVRDEVMTYDVKQGVEVLSDPGVSDKRFFVLDEEFGGALANTRREGNTLSCVLRSAWDSGDLDPITKTTKTRATGAHIGWVSHITLDELTRKLPESEGLNGFGNRILWVCARRSKLVPLPEPMDILLLDGMRQRLQRNIEWASRSGALHLSERAKKEWCDRYYPELGAEKPGFVGVITNRAEAQVMRLAMAYALLDQSVTIDIDHLEAAIAMWRYCEASAALIFRGKVGDQTQERILQALKNKSPLTGTEVRAIFSNHLSKDALTFALSELARSGRIESAEIKGPGRPVTRYFLKTPGVLSAKSAISHQCPEPGNLFEHKALKTPSVSEIGGGYP